MDDSRAPADRPEPNQPLPASGPVPVVPAAVGPPGDTVLIDPARDDEPPADPAGVGMIFHDNTADGDDDRNQPDDRSAEAGAADGDGDGDDAPIDNDPLYECAHGPQHAVLPPVRQGAVDLAKNRNDPDILWLRAGHALERLSPATLRRVPPEGLLWLDFTRDDSAGWEAWPRHLLGLVIDHQHISDSCSTRHTSVFESTPDYDVLIFEGLGPPKADPFPIANRTAAFFLFDRMVLTVRASDNVSVPMVKQRLAAGRIKPPTTAVRLVHLVLDTMVDRYMAIREPMEDILTQLQDRLLDPEQEPGPDDWRKLLSHRREARRLETLCEHQLDALNAWRRQSRTEWPHEEQIRVRDLSEHVSRVLDHAENLQADIESAVQLHFASVSHKTNRVVQTLTVFSAVFLPLTLMAGIWGMNFENMPELKTPYGYFVALATMLTVGAVLLLVFKRKKYF